MTRRDQATGRFLKTDPDKVIARFWGNVKIRDSKECWPWMGRINANGYGVFYNPKTQQDSAASRVMWILTHGPLTEDLSVRRLSNA